MFLLYFSDVLQWKIDDHYSGDGLKLNYENKMQLETIENEFDGLKVVYTVHAFGSPWISLSF